MTLRTLSIHARLTFPRRSRSTVLHGCLARMRMPLACTYGGTTAGILTVEMRVSTLLQPDGFAGGDSTPDRGLEIETKMTAGVIASWPPGPWLQLPHSMRIAFRRLGGASHFRASYGCRGHIRKLLWTAITSTASLMSLNDRLPMPV
jgi:hypothetical protein